MFTAGTVTVHTVPALIVTADTKPNSVTQVMLSISLYQAKMHLGDAGVTTGTGFAIWQSSANQAPAILNFLLAAGDALYGVTGEPRGVELSYLATA